MSMTIYRFKKHKVISTVLVLILCFSVFTGRVFAVNGCNASCCVGNQMDEHGRSMVQIVDDFPCPCCSTSVACAVEKTISAMPLPAILHDGERYSSSLSSDEFAAVETHQKIENGVSLRFTEPPTKIPIYIATLNLIR